MYQLCKKGLLAASLVLGACAPAEEVVPYQKLSGGVTELNGRQLNGPQLNGAQPTQVYLSGLALDGRPVNQLRLKGAYLSGAPITDLKFERGVLSGQVSGNLPRSVFGAALVGTILDVQVGNVAYQFQINRVDVDTQSGFQDIYLYEIVFRNNNPPGPWLNLCTDAKGSPVAAVSIENYWNMKTGARIDAPGTITFACVNGAIGKCVRWGYRPWAMGKTCSGPACTSISLKEHHQACTRMVRADYCGKGQPHTVDGTVIDVFDALTPPVQSRVTQWPIEAMWRPDGATCVSATRLKALTADGSFSDCKGNERSRDDVVECTTNYLVGSALLGNSSEPRQP